VEMGVWASREPSAFDGTCAYVSNYGTLENAQYAWSMTSCDHVMPFVCERNPCPSGAVLLNVF